MPEKKDERRINEQREEGEEENTIEEEESDLFENHDRWRLEKFQVGRRKFP